MHQRSSSLSGALRGLSFQDAHPTQLSLTAPWGATLPRTGEPGLYIVKEGTAWISSGSEAKPVQLGPNDVALLPRGVGHAICSYPDVRIRPIAEFFAQHGGERGDDVRGAGGGGPAAELDTFCFRIQSANARALLGMLPELVILPCAVQRVWVSHLARALSALLESPERDMHAASDLAEVLFGVVLRSTMIGEIGANDRPDEAVTLALTMIHADLAHNWTASELARRVGRSKSSFHDRFARATGESPMQYIAIARMTHARELLKNTELSIQQIAEVVGYQTASAFAAAFRRQSGAAPSTVRRAAIGH